MPRNTERRHWGLMPPFVPGSAAETPAGAAAPQAQPMDVGSEPQSYREPDAFGAGTGAAADPWMTAAAEPAASDDPWATPAAEPADPWATPAADPEASSDPWATPVTEPVASDDPWAALADVTPVDPWAEAAPADVPAPDAPWAQTGAGDASSGDEPASAGDEPWAVAGAGDEQASDAPGPEPDAGAQPLNAEPWASAPETEPAGAGADADAEASPGAPAEEDLPEDPAEGSWAGVMPGTEEPYDPWTASPPAGPWQATSTSADSGFGDELTLGYTPVFAPQSWPDEGGDEPVHPLDDTPGEAEAAWPADGWDGESPAAGGTPSGALPEAFFADAFFTPRVTEGDSMEEAADAQEAERAMAAQVAVRLADLSQQIRERGFSALTDTPDPDQLARIIAGMVAGFVARSE